jgi:RNA polymerase sigma factor (sigma-70 family)
MEDASIANDLFAAGRGDEDAWRRLVGRFAGLVWAVARGYRLSDADAQDVSQTTWLRLAEHLDRIRDPERLGTWLATTAGRESLRLLKRRRRELPVGEHEDLEPVGAEVARPEARLEARERSAALWQAFRSLSERCYRLLRLLLADPPPSYEEVGAALGMKIGSIGPTRARCLADLREKMALQGISGQPGGSS